MKSISSVQFNIQINGLDYEGFKGGRGLKQGDPLSPLLFVLSLEYLSRLLRRTSQSPHFKFHPKCKQTLLTHLCFADDLILFSRADPATLQSLMATLTEFEHTAGLRTNLSKSQMVFGGADTELQQKCLQIVGLNTSTLPLTYLSVPIVASRLTKVECTQLITKIKAKVNQWSTRHISYAGQLVLINSVIFGMINYWASIFLLPNDVIERLTQICRNFLWNGNAEPISWQRSCMPKSKGGLGIKDLATWNKATIAKLVWAVAQKRDILWVRWVHGRYTRGKNWWEYTPPHDNSWYWKKLCRVKDIFTTANDSNTPCR